MCTIQRESSVKLAGSEIIYSERWAEARGFSICYYSWILYSIKIWMQKWNHLVILLAYKVTTKPRCKARFTSPYMHIVVRISEVGKPLNLGIVQVRNAVGIHDASSMGKQYQRRNREQRNSCRQCPRRLSSEKADQRQTCPHGRNPSRSICKARNLTDLGKSFPWRRHRLSTCLCIHLPMGW